MAQSTDQDMYEKHIYINSRHSLKMKKIWILAEKKKTTGSH